MAKSLKEEIYDIEVQLISELKSTFHTVCTKFGNIVFTDGKATIPSNQPELLQELQNLNVIAPPVQLETPVEPPTTGE